MFKHNLTVRNVNPLLHKRPLCDRINANKDQCRLIAFDLVFCALTVFFLRGLFLQVSSCPSMHSYAANDGWQVQHRGHYYMSFMVVSFENIRERYRPTAVCEDDLTSYSCIPTCIR